MKEMHIWWRKQTLELTSDGRCFERAFSDVRFKLDNIVFCNTKKHTIWIQKEDELREEWNMVVFFICHRQTIIKKTRFFSFSSFKKLWIKLFVIWWGRVLFNYNSNRWWTPKSKHRKLRLFCFVLCFNRYIFNWKIIVQLFKLW
jgi:hypothetical protein